jgi:glycosyltransferase involved in cell wall biosynthesis
MKIAVCMITLDEGRFIERAVSSIAWADLLIVVDGESADNTREIIKEKCPIQSKIITHLWADHFGDQRQLVNDLVAIEQVDWWVRLDADEEFPPIWENIRQIIEPFSHRDCFKVRQNNLVERYDLYSANRGGWETHPRLFKNLRLPDGSAWRWQGQVHEYCQLMTRNGLVYPEAALINLPVTHFGWLDQERRQEREKLYLAMPGSSFIEGELLNRIHQIKTMPYHINHRKDSE